MLAVLLTGLVLFKRPTITGKAVSDGESAYSDTLSIQKNESGTYEWNVKNPGNIKAVKASGSVSANGTAKV